MKLNRFHHTFSAPLLPVTSLPLAPSLPSQSSLLPLPNIINCMFVGDPQSLVTHLNNDWTVLLRNLKARQDQHLELLQYNQRIINQVRQQNSQLFIKDEILQHQRQHGRMADGVEGMEREEREIVEKYEGVEAREDGVVRLMARVGARVVETCQGAVDKSKHYDETVAERHAKMRRGLVDLLNHKEGIRLQETIKCVTSYSRDKLILQLEKLKRLINALENGQHFKLREVYFPKERKQVKSVQRKMDILRDLSKAKAEKEMLRTEQKNNEKLRKQRQRMMNHLYSTMELSKQQSTHEEDTQTPQEKIEKLYNEILVRNRFNSEQIMEFEGRKGLFEEKVRQFKEYMETQGKKITQVFIRKPFKKEKQQPSPRPHRNPSPHGKSLLSELESNIENIMTEGNLEAPSKVQRRLLNTQQFKFKSISTKKQINDLPNLFNSFVNPSDNLSHFRFDAAHREIFSRSNRNVLPDIAKGTSLDQKTQITKIKIDKILRTTIKNEERGQRRTVGINREEIKMMEDATRFRINFKNIDFGTEVLRRNVMERQRNEQAGQDNSLHVRKAEIRHYEPKLNVLL